MSFHLEWRKLRIDPDTRLGFDQVVADFNKTWGGEFRVITHPFGKIIACPVEDLWFFRVGDGGRPARIWTLALSSKPQRHPLFPAQREWDFDECCNQLGYQNEEDRGQFRQFLCPSQGRAAAPTAQGQGAL